MNHDDLIYEPIASRPTVVAPKDEGRVVFHRRSPIADQYHVFVDAVLIGSYEFDARWSKCSLFHYLTGGLWEWTQGDIAARDRAYNALFGMYGMTINQVMAVMTIKS